MDVGELQGGTASQIWHAIAIQIALASSGLLHPLLLFDHTDELTKLSENQKERILKWADELSADGQSA
jgi:hypothetical protein